MAIRPRLLVLVLALVACGGDDSDPGSELGPCVQGRYCEQPLVCTEGICVHPDQLAEDGSADDGFDDGGIGQRFDMGGSGPVTSAGDGSGGDATAGDATAGDATGGEPEIYCTLPGEDGCFCAHTADYGPLGQACSESTVPSPGQCCASQGWPAYGGCSCWALSCRRDFDSCYCGIGTPEPEDEPVGSCTAEGGVCCRDTSDGTCGCWNSITTCLEGAEQVGSCSVADLGCGTDTRVSACN
jgi:hypothetical protein